MTNLAEMLLTWYDGAKRDLPWRRDSDPYKIWVSEIMLQQTRVEAVRPYYERWLERFPRLGDLAAASDDEVIGYWQGLGYYSRARRLLQGVREVQATYGGRVPDNRPAIMAVPGIGDYTAGAILSIAYDRPEPAVDGNVLRIFSRLHCLEDDIATSAARRKVEALVVQSMPDRRCGDFNQALMDLGATICLPKTPRCGDCPLHSRCCAHSRGVQQEFPVKRKASAPRQIQLAAAVVEDGGRYLLRRRPDQGLLARMWEFPAVEVGVAEDPRPLLEAAVLTGTGQTVRTGEQLLELDHVFSHRRWHILFYQCSLLDNAPLTGSDTCWLSPADWAGISFAGPHRRMAGQLAGDGRQITP
ncbi:MAG: A/G-specific adenine glycosylase [Negativicutes bacterium]|nr:A/G-specific adenine glycosylase [Negativicutes bacterium]